jgi:hypothetical protein
VVEGVGGRFGLLCGLKSILLWRALGGLVVLVMVDGWEVGLCLWLCLVCGFVLLPALAEATETVSWGRRGRLIRMLLRMVVLVAQLDEPEAAAAAVPAVRSMLALGLPSTSP